MLLMGEEMKCKNEIALSLYNFQRMIHVLCVCHLKPIHYGYFSILSFINFI